MTIDARRFPRKRVHLQVAYRKARDFVQQYAENLSAGGMFIRDADGLALRDEVTIELTLPGHGAYTVVAEVAHVVGADDPARRHVGVGLQIKHGPPGFQDALNAYLLRLGRRAAATVFVDVEPWRELIADAGYRVAPLPPPHGLITVIGDASAVGILAPQELVESYAAALAFLGGDHTTVIPVHPKLPLDPVLAWLDDKLLDK